jgi:hypothetical protein
MRVNPLRLLAIVTTITLVMLASTARANILITINKSTQQMTVTRDGEVLYRWPVSTGRAGYDTPSGTFQAFRMEADHYSKEWDDAPMPHSIFFTKAGHAIHGYLNTSRIGTPASHGCVRLHPENAAKLYALVEMEGVLKTTVVLTGHTPSSAPAVAARRTPPTVTAEDETDNSTLNTRPQYPRPLARQDYYRQDNYRQDYYRQPDYYRSPDNYRSPGYSGQPGYYRDPGYYRQYERPAPNSIFPFN